MENTTIIGHVDSIGWLATLAGKRLTLSLSHRELTFDYETAKEAEHKFDHLLDLYVNFGLDRIEAHLTEKAATT